MKIASFSVFHVVGVDETIKINLRMMFVFLSLIDKYYLKNAWLALNFDQNSCRCGEKKGILLVKYLWKNILITNL